MAANVTAAAMPPVSAAAPTAGVAGGGVALAPVKKANTCAQCQQAIDTVAKFIQVGEYNFHLDHFVCCVCHTTLHDKKFHHRKGKFYCGKDFADAFSKVCFHCKQRIVSGKVVQAFGKDYHPEHFVCHKCGKAFEEDKCFDHDNLPYCENCFLDATAPKCDVCHLPVTDSNMTQLGEKYLHRTCLKCSHCGKSVGASETEPIFQKDNEVYCQEDYLDFFARQCTACGEYIRSEIVAVNDEYYHPEHLMCGQCGRPLESYICVGGELRCEEHSELPPTPFDCDVCNQPLLDENDIMLACGRRAHRECFACHFCQTPLLKTTAKVKYNVFICPNCIRKPEAELAAATDEADQPQTFALQVDQASDAPQPQQSSDNYDDGEIVVGPDGEIMFDEFGAPLMRTSAANTTENGTTPTTSRSVNTRVHSDDDDDGGYRDRVEPLSVPAAQSAAGKHKKNATWALGDNKNGEDDSREQKIDWTRGDLIGKGAFGKVYMALNNNTGEYIAVKQVKLNSKEDEKQASDIRSEINLMKQLRHPHVVNLLGTEVIGNTLNILMEYVPGKGLDVHLAQFGPLAETVIQLYTRQILEALAYCHSNNIVHRDIKGKNILVDGRNVKLCDFGSAKVFDNMVSAAPSLTYNYTPLWTAPEVLTGVYNSKVDIWSLGCVIIEMATAKPPWSDQNFENPFRALYHIGNSNSIPTIPPNLSEAAKIFLTKCLRRDPKTRPSAAELLKDPWIAQVPLPPYSPNPYGR